MKNAVFKSWLNPKKWFEGDSRPAEQVGLGLGTAFFVLALVAFLREMFARAETLSIIAALIAGSAIIYPRMLVPLEKILRKSFLALAWLNTKLMLILVYYLVFTPIGLLLKLFGKKLLEKEFPGKGDSYFEQRQESEYRPDRDELQF